MHQRDTQSSAETVFQKAKSFVYRNARPLDLVRWQYHFENGGKETVLNALFYYQNENGGCGHALEPDCWNPNSTPIHTWVATEILKEIDFYDTEHPLIENLIKYLSSGEAFSGHFWYRTVPSNNEYPHAPWWTADDGYQHENNYNPTASLSGFYLFCGDRESAFYKIAEMIAREAVDAYLSNDNPEMHAIVCYIHLLEYCEKAGIEDLFDMDVFRNKLILDVKKTINRDTSRWSTSYVCKPSQFFNDRKSPFYLENREIAEYECDFIEKTQLENGAWAITWNWNQYQKEYAISANRWQAAFAVKNMLYLKGMGKLS